MSHPNLVMSGPDNDDMSEHVNYEDDNQLQAESDSDSDYNHKRRRSDKASSSSSQQTNHIKQSSSNAHAAASAASLASSSSAVTGEQRDLQLATLIKRVKRKEQQLRERELELDAQLKASSKSSKRSRASNSRRGDGDSSDSSDSDTTDMSDMGSDSNGGNGHGRRSSSSSKGLDDKDASLRQLAVSTKFHDLSYVDIRVFTRNNLNVRKARKLSDINSSAEFIAAWASYNVELQQYLITAHRGADALMVTKYYSQLVRLLTDFPSQWELVMEMDTYVRGSGFVIGDHVVWSIDHDDDHVSQFRLDIRLGHQQLDVASRARAATPSTRRGGPTGGVGRRGGNHGGGATSSRQRDEPNVCFRFNGELSPHVWTERTHCSESAVCKFQHKCIVCRGDHPAFANPQCAAKPRERPAPRQRRH
jgi:hypothetical protein